MVRSPKVSVVLPVHNCEHFVAQAVESILSQSYRDLELVAIDDGSRDGSLAILRSFTDPRLVILVNETNLGLIKTLNKGFAAARGQYLARMDADDIAHPDRLSVQISRLESNPDLGGISCLPHQMDESGRNFRRSHLYETTTTAAIEFVLAFENPVLHPGIVLRREAMDGLSYRDEIEVRHVEDYDLWARMVLAGHRIESIAVPLLLFRMNAGSVTSRHKDEQERNHHLIASNFARTKFRTSVSDDAIRLMHYPKQIASVNNTQAAFAEVFAFRSKNLPSEPHAAKEIDRWMLRKFFLATAATAKLGQPFATLRHLRWLLRLAAASRIGYLGSMMYVFRLLRDGRAKHSTAGNW
jgi:glycosyltransferase involved in cell wall biosynthesis